MAKQTLMWTCLPNGISDDRKNLRLSVMVSPKLDAEGDAKELASFPEWLDWPATISNAVFIFVANGQPVAKTMVGENNREARHDIRLGAPDSRIWQALFRPDFFVASYDLKRDLNDILKSEVLSYSVTDVHDLVKEMYVDLAARSNEHLPRIGRDLLDNDLWRELVNSVQQVDRWGLKQASRDLLPRFDGEETAETKHQIGRRFATLDKVLKNSGGNRLAQKVHHLARFELFHTPPLRPKPMQQVARDDDAQIFETREEFEQPKVPTPEELKKVMHFHSALAAMNNYPTLLRHLGLVVDFEISRDLFPEDDAIALEVMVEFPAPLPTLLDTSVDNSPTTRVTHRNDQFFSSSRPHLNPNRSLRIDRGLLDLYSNPDRFAVLQADVDSAALKLMNFARTLGTYDDAKASDPAILRDDVNRHEKEAGAPSLRTGGISLVRKERADALKRRFADNQRQVNEAKTPTGVELWAEDVTRGYRIDVWDTKVGQWRSLCRRQANYELERGNILLNPLAGEEEATVQMATTRAPDPTYNHHILYLHEAMVAWAGWSLAAPQPGLAVGDDVNDKGPDGKPKFTEGSETVDGLDFKSTFSAVPGSLPRLRYGRRYALRVRAVDLAGNSLPPSAKNLGPENPENEAQPFLRFEAVAAPILALPDNGDQPTPPDYGESMYRLAIRSFNDRFDDTTLSTQSCGRFAVPPQSTVREAELHGMLDQAGVVSASTFQMLALEKDRDAKEPEAALQEHIFALKGPLDREDERVATTYSVWREGRAITYLPDPMAEVVSAWFIDHPGIDAQKTLHIPLYPNGAHWPDAEPFRIELFEDADALAAPFYDEARHSLRIPLAKGERAKLRLAMRMRKRDLFERMGLWQWLDAATQDKIAQATLDGRSWLFTPWQEIELVHAVQRPLLKPNIQNLVINRGQGQTFCIPHFEAQCSLQSTDRLDLFANWNEPVDPIPAINQARGDLAFQIKVTGQNDYVSDLDALRDHSLPNEEGNVPNIIGINSRRVDRKAEKLHEFNDTRYRRIEDHLQATSRYREYLPPELLLAPFPAGEGETPAPIDTHISLRGEPAVGWVPNSAPPPAPKILYVVPTFGWSRTQGDDGARHSWRRGGGLRVYLDRQWNATGYGEMLAVILPLAGSTQDPETEPTSHPGKNFITQWGRDPLWSSPNVVGVAPSIGNFPRARLAPDPSGQWLPNGAPITEADQQPGNFLTNFRINDTLAEIAPHDVFFDELRQLWYCDIELDHGDSYWPFIRLALARYQPTSTEGAYLSEIVLADFMQLTVDRWATVRRGARPGIHEVSLFGSSYTESAGAREVRELHPLVGAVSSLQPARFAETTVAEVWLERLNPALGEDFGWQRIAEGTPTAPLVIDPQFPRLQAQKIAISKFDNLRFKVQRNAPFSSQLIHANLLNPSLIERWFKPKPLWEGSINSPEDNNRYRIVIAEYEEYPVDGAMPHDIIPTTIGRRLVFVEHIELT